jgi:hypothetical protein
MFSLSFSRQLLVRRSSTSLGSRGALPLGTGRMLRRAIMSEAQLTPLEDLSEPRQRLRRVLDDYRHKKYVSGREGDCKRLSVCLPASLSSLARGLCFTRPILSQSLIPHSPYFHFFALALTALDKRSFLDFSRK